MGASSPAPPGDGQMPEGEDDELELTSIMDAEQRRALQKAARALKVEEAKEPERPTARPPPDVAAAIQEEVSIPKPQPVPGEAAARQAASPGASGSEARPGSGAPAVERKAQAVKAAAAGAHPAAAPNGHERPLRALAVVAFVLLAAAVAFVMSR